MGLLKSEDFKSHMYAEIINEIIRDDSAILNKAIKRAESEAKAYLNRYDTSEMFKEDFDNEHLRGLVLDIACWHLCKLANPNINMELFKDAYKYSIRFLEQVQAGGPDPEWPLKPNNPNTPIDEGGNVEYYSNPKRVNHF